ncbi:nucleoside diphosphate kinase-like [Bolinopsis microptera]|uniref:nucleoside diphosphate kinase-like n=1 Tax=Bolinopsis microptera TaxID=2820187 RepID=UPI00307A2E7D
MFAKKWKAKVDDDDREEVELEAPNDDDDEWRFITSQLEFSQPAATAVVGDKGWFDKKKFKQAVKFRGQAPALFMSTSHIFSKADRSSVCCVPTNSFCSTHQNYHVWVKSDVDGRQMLGETNPLNSKPGSIRGDYCIDMGKNICHGSDSVENAEKEIAMWFGEGEVQSYVQSNSVHIYE